MHFFSLLLYLPTLLHTPFTLPSTTGILLILSFSPPADLQGTSPVPFFCNPFHFLEFIGLHYLPKQPGTIYLNPHLTLPIPTSTAVVNPNQPPFSFVLLSEFFLQMQWILKLLNSIHTLYTSAHTHTTHSYLPVIFFAAVVISTKDCYHEICIKLLT